MLGRSIRTAIAIAVIMPAGFFLGSGVANSAGASTPLKSSKPPKWLLTAKQIAAQYEKIPTKIADASLGSFHPKKGGHLYVVDCDLALEGCSHISTAFAAAAGVLHYSIKQCNGGARRAPQASAFRMRSTLTRVRSSSMESMGPSRGWLCEGDRSPHPHHRIVHRGQGTDQRGEDRDCGCGVREPGENPW